MVDQIKPDSVRRLRQATKDGARFTTRVPAPGKARLPERVCGTSAEPR